jgi:hypothetical protein
MFTVHYMSTKVHDDWEINNHEVKEINFALTKVGVTRSGKSRGWESGSRDGTVQDARGENSGCVVRKKKGEKGGSFVTTATTNGRSGGCRSGGTE